MLYEVITLPSPSEGFPWRTSLSNGSASQLMERLHRDYGAGCADRVAQGNAAAVGVEALARQLELLGDGQCLGCEGLVDLVDVDVADAQAVAFA